MGHDTWIRSLSAVACAAALAAPSHAMAQDPVQVQRPHTSPPAATPSPAPTDTATPAPEPTTPTDAATAPTTDEATTSSGGSPTSEATTEAITEATTETSTQADAAEDAAIAPFRSAWEQQDAPDDADVAASEPVTYDLDDSERKLARAQTMIAAGSVAGVGALVMLIAAGVEHNKPPCMFGLDDCSNAPRPAVATGLAIGGALLLGVGATLIGFGAAKQRRLRMGMRGDRTQVSVAISGRF